MTAPRTILHADLDAFYAAVEQRDDPALRGKPVIVGGLGPRGVVATASYEARAFGVRSAMSMARARKLAPGAVYLRPRMRDYVAVSRQVFAIFDGFTPLVEGLSLDEAFLDVGGSRRLFGDGETIARSIRQAVRETTGLGISVGVASNKFVAKVASDLRKPDGLVVVPPGEEARFLAPLAISRLWGAGPRLVERLRGLGLDRIRDLQALAPEDLRRILGDRAGGHFGALARGLDDREVSNQRETHSISRETTFARDVCDQARLERVLAELARDVGRRLRHACLRARCIRLKLRLPDFHTFSRQHHPARAIDRDADLIAEGRALLHRLHDEGMPVRLIGLGGADLVEAEAQEQLELFGAEAEARAEGLQDALDRIRARFGAEAIRPLDDDAPSS
ncbi:MAG: DNA polymerase IV [Planctomycetes bacterium]|nr:DNA polymerase IV [Planctomycetota bacterium]